MGQCTLDENQVREVLLYLHSRGYSVRKLAELFGVGKSTIHRVLQGEQKPPDVLRVKLCVVLPEEELLRILKGPQILRQYGLIDEEGRLNRVVILAIFDALMQDVVLKEEVLNFFLKYYKRELMERLSEALPKIEFRWAEEFERWLTERKSKPVSQRTLRDYRYVWNLCLEGKTLGWHLLKRLEGSKMMCSDGEYHPTPWVRQIFRHYIRYLYGIGKLDWDTYTRLLLSIPGRRYGRKLAQKPINREDVVKTLETLKEKRPDIYMLYLLMLFSGTRFEHTLSALKAWSPDEELYVSYLARNIKRLECLETHCRYYLGGELDRKPKGFIFFPKSLLPMIEEHRSKLPSKRRIEKIVAKLECLTPKYIRIYAIREMLSVLGDNDTTKFILSKFGELSVSARHYRDLLEEADKVYPNYIAYLKQELNTYLELQ